MRFPAMTAGLGLVGAAAAVTSMKACNEDNCLRAVQASNFPTRHGTADCSSYFLVTVTPVTTTITTTITQFSSSTHTADVTSTSIVDVTATSVSDIAATSSLGITATSVVDVTATSTVDVTETDSVTSSMTIVPPKVRRNPNIENHEVAPRQATVNPSSIPAYASACSGAVRYSSACSCVGVTARTTTVASPSTTLTLTATVTTVVATVQTTDLTTVSTVTDGTSVITSTTGTITDTFTAATSLTTVTDSTASITTTTTATTTIAPTGSVCESAEGISSFIIQVGDSGTPYDSQYAVLGNTGNNDHISFSSNEDDGTIFTFNDNCNLVGFNGEIANITPGDGQSTLFFNTPDQINDFGYAAANCAVTGGVLTCDDNSDTIFEECEEPTATADVVSDVC